MAEVLVDAYLAALKSMGGDSPKPLAKRASFMAEDIDPTVDVSPERLVAHLADADANDRSTEALGARRLRLGRTPDGRSVDRSDWVAHPGASLANIRAARIDPGDGRVHRQALPAYP